MSTFVRFKEPTKTRYHVKLHKMCEQWFSVASSFLIHKRKIKGEDHMLPKSNHFEDSPQHNVTPSYINY